MWVTDVMASGLSVTREAASTLLSEARRLATTSKSSVKSSYPIRQRAPRLLTLSNSQEYGWYMQVDQHIPEKGFR